jgi:CelD/BcsL family acetyltransferase involved in cellulose biosynthesis
MGQWQQNRVVLTGPASRDEWEDACAASPDTTAFHRYDFLESVAPSLRCEFVPLSVLANGQPVGIAPLLVKQLGPFSTVNWVPFPYLGPLVPAALIDATLSALTLEARRRRAVNHQQSFSHVIEGHQGGGFASLTDRTFVIPLSNRSDEDLLAAIPHKRRQQIRRAQRAGLEVCSAEAGDFRLMGAWLSQVFAAQGLRAPYPAETYGRVFKALRSTPGSFFHTARLNGQTVAVKIAISTPRRAFAWQTAVDHSHQLNYPQALLTWHSLLWARDAGVMEFDLVGAPNDGIAAYKKGFGALERHYTVLHRQARAHRTILSVLSHPKIPLKA